MEFTGFPVAALDFYDDLEVDNTKSFWDKHKHVYDDSVKAPMTALCDALGKEFGEAKIFRPYRDVRFAKDKTPYKTHQGAFVRVADATGWYVELSPRGVRTGGGYYHAEAPRLAALRDAIAHDTYGAELERIVRGLERKGFTIGGDVLKTDPAGLRQGPPADRPAPAQVGHRQPPDRLRAGGPHPEAARPGPQGLAGDPAAGRVGAAARGALGTPSGHHWKFVEGGPRSGCVHAFPGSPRNRERSERFCGVDRKVPERRPTCSSSERRQRRDVFPGVPAKARAQRAPFVGWEVRARGAGHPTSFR